MNSRIIKLIAAAAMAIDHTGLVLFPDYTVFRIIGRISMPLFCLLIAYGSLKTRSQFKYFVRLFVFAVFCQFYLNFIRNGSVLDFTPQLNVFFTLSLGAFSVWLVGKSRHFLVSLFFIMFVMLITLLTMVFIGIEYHAAGVLLILSFYLGLKYSDKSLKLFKISAFFSLVLFNLVLFVFSDWYIQGFSLLAFIFIYFFADRKLCISEIEKWAFYLFYPLHFTVLYLIDL